MTPSARPPAAPRLPRSLDVAAVAPDALSDGARLQGVEVAAAELAGLQARSVDVREARLVDCDLSGARLTSLGLLDCELLRCNLANLLGRDSAMVRTAVAESRMTGFSWPEGKIRDVVFRGCRIDLAALRFATLQRVTFEDCVLREADFQEARFESVRFAGCDLTGATFQGARFERSELRRCRLDDLRGVDGLRGAALEWGDIVGLAGAFAAALGVRLLDDDA